MEHKLEEAIMDGIQIDVQLDHFMILSVPSFQQHPRLTPLYFFSFFNQPLTFDCTFRWQQSSAIEQLNCPET